MRDPIPDSAKSEQSSITHPEAERAHRDLSWAPQAEAQAEEREHGVYRQTGDEDNGPDHVYASYAGGPDGSWTITVTVERLHAVAHQTESGSGEKGHALREAKQKAYEKAERAVTILLSVAS